MERFVTKDNMNRAHGKRFDFDRVLSSVRGKENITSIQASIALGDFLRNVREREGVTQSALAERVGTTQPHISEIERGLGKNGPSVGTVARLLTELGDELLVVSRKEQALRMAQQIGEAETALGEIAEQIARDEIYDLDAIMNSLYEANRAEGNPFKNVLFNGVIIGIYLVSQAQMEADTSIRDRTRKLEIIRNLSDSGFAGFFSKLPVEH